MKQEQNAIKNQRTTNKNLLEIKIFKAGSKWDEKGKLRE